MREIYKLQRVLNTSSDYIWFFHNLFVTINRIKWEETVMVVHEANRNYTIVELVLCNGFRRSILLVRNKAGLKIRYANYRIK